jgi:hypothetical protein
MTVLSQMILLLTVSVYSGTTVYAQSNWWGSSKGPDGRIEDPDHSGMFVDGSGDEILGHVYFYPWLDSDPFGNKEFFKLNLPNILLIL